jgi:cytoskeletal protein CcmA (bactofilin family)
MAQNPTDTQNPSENQSRSGLGLPGKGYTSPFQAGGMNRAAAPASPYASSAPAYGASSAADMGRKLVVGQGITLAGEIQSCDHLIVEGRVEAALKGAKMLDIAEAGTFVGTVEIDEAVIAGAFEGDIIVQGRLTVRSTGKINGTISYKELAVEAGATVEGSLTPLGAKVAAKKNNDGVSMSMNSAMNSEINKAKTEDNKDESLFGADKMVVNG